MASGHVERRSKHGWTLVIDYGRVVDLVTKTERQRREYRAIRNCTKAEALAQLHDTLSEINRGVYMKPSPLTVGDYLHQWYDQRCVPRLSPSTLQNYLVCIDKHLIPRLGEHRLKELRPEHLQVAYNAMLAEGAHPRTVQQVHQVLHIALAQAMRWLILPRNVANLVDTPRVVKRETGPHSLDDLTRLVDNAVSPLREIVILAMRTGLRRGELLALRWQDVDLDNRLLKVERTLQRIGGRFIFKAPKTWKSRRTVPLDKETANRLRSWREANPHDLVFCRQDGQPLDPSRLTHTFLDLARRLGLKMRFHDLRHAYASLALMAGVDMRVVQELMGHEDIATTVNTYTHVMEAVKRQAADAIGNLLKNGERRLSDDPADHDSKDYPL